VIALGKGQQTPLPWINVVANEAFGFQASESGAGFTWSQNSRENQLTPWSNDPVSAQPAEVFYIQDLATGALWTPTALPVRIDDASYVARFGQGYVKFEQAAEDIRSELTQFVIADAPVKLSSLTLTNEGATTRELGVTAYGDRAEFVGRNGRLDAPEALVNALPMSGRTGAALDPCAALQRRITLPPGATIRLLFALGEAASPVEAAAMAERYRAADVDAELVRVVDGWDDVLGTLSIAPASTRRAARTDSATNCRT
jgi:cyclic beta-1,2-glucan synthetase